MLYREWVVGEMRDASTSKIIVALVSLFLGKKEKETFGVFGVFWCIWMCHFLECQLELFSII